MTHDPETSRQGPRSIAGAPRRNDPDSSFDDLAELFGAPNSALSAALEHLLVRCASAYLDPTDERQAAFYDWRARAARAAQTPEEHIDTERAARAFAERVLCRNPIARALTRAGVRRVDAAPPRMARGAERDSATGGIAPIYDAAVAAGIGRELWDEPCTEWIRLPEDLTGNAYVALRVSGDSMEPLLHTGDTILVRLGPSVAVDRIVVARHPTDGYVVKRVAHIGTGEIELASLNEAYGSLTIPADTSFVLGTVILRWCPHGTGHSDPRHRR